jgi:Cu+-exporting ATPase
VLGTTPENDIVRLAASLERNSAHPLAAAIAAAASERGIDVPDASNFVSVTGKGLTGDVDGHAVALGNAKLMLDAGLTNSDAANAEADGLRVAGATVLFLSIDGRAAAMIAIADPIKATTPAAIEQLRANGMRIVMLTGDNRVTAGAVAGKLGITEIEADVLPDDKQRIVAAFKAQGLVVAMAGDGVNDAPALAAADVGIAMGTGTEVAIQSAGITLVKGDLAGVARAIALSRATMRNIRENLLFAFAYNVIGIPIAAGVLYPAFGLVLSPMIAALAMSFSSVSVIVNALRLRSAKF